MSKKNIAEKVLNKIKSEEIKMKPKYYFMFGSLFLGIGMFASFIVTFFITNIVVFRLRINNPARYLPIHKTGGLMFLQNIPWVYIFSAILFFGLGIYLLKKYDIAYKKSLGLIGLGILVSIIVSGLLADKVGFSKRMLRHPGAKRIYLRNIESCFSESSDIPCKEVRGIRNERKMPLRMYK